MLESSPQSGLLPDLVSVETTLAGERWSILVSEDLAAAVSADCPLHGASAGIALQARPRLQAALAIALTGATAPRFRAVVDGGDALFGALFERGFRRIRLGSPGFAVERAQATLAEALSFAQQRGEGDRVVAITEHAAMWRLVSADDAPLDIDRAIALHDLDDVRDAAAFADVEAAARTLADDLAPRLAAYRPGLLERLSQWGLGLQADYPVLRVHALRLVAALPSVDHDVRGGEVARLVGEMLRRTRADHRRAQADGGALALPTPLVAALALAAVTVAILPASWVAGLTRWAVRRVAGIFIAGEDVQRARPALQALTASGRAATLDQLGELVVTADEADHYRDAVLALIDGAAALHTGARNSADLPLAHVSVKVSALSAHYDAIDVEGTWRRVGPRLRMVLRRAMELGVFINLDAEHESVRDLTLEMLRRALRSDDALWQHRDVGIVVQAYLRDAPAHLAAVVELARERAVCMPIRLVKGAYWDAETTEADAHRYEAPQWLNKVETDLCFSALTLVALREGAFVQLAVGSHNIHDHCFARAARTLRFPDAPAIEHQCLHATYEALSMAMAGAGWPVRNYIPVGSMLMGMAYLVRRVMENSSQVGVLTMARGDVHVDVAMRPPAQMFSETRSTLARRALLCDDGDDLAFRQTAPARLHLADHRDALDEAIGAQAALPWLAALTAATEAFRHGPGLATTSPEAPTHLLATVATATAADVASAVQRADVAAPAWQQQGARCRALRLIRAGERLRGLRVHLAALIIAEAGKTRFEALGDVDEAIDFCAFYAREALALEDDGPRAARGVIGVIAPWNFPLAIPCGMTVAALAAGNAAVLKSAEQTPLCAEALLAVLHAVGVPRDVVCHVPGDGPTTGAALASDATLDGVVFTGSASVGTALHAAMAARAVRNGGVGTRMVITEMGGKNAAIVTANADLDEAVAGCVASAFAHAGQKCSALSRVLIDERIYEAFALRFAAAAAELHVGGGSACGTHINAVISADDADRLRKAAKDAIAEAVAAGGRVLLDGSQPLLGDGHLVGPTVIALPRHAARATSSFAKRELFGPIVHCIPCVGLQGDDGALALLGDVPYALTGGAFAQSEDDVEAVIAGAHVGNLYLNRTITGARVATEPFGGFKMSGTGPKAGGGGYIDAFYAPMAADDTASDDTASDDTASDDTASDDTASDDTASVATKAGATAPSAALRGQCAAALAGQPQADAVNLAAVIDAAHARDSLRNPTHLVAGQQSWNQRRHLRGATLVLATGPSLAGDAGAWARAWTHATACALAGGHVVVCGPAPGLVARSQRVGDGTIEVHASADVDAALGRLLGADVATVILVGGVAPWSATLAATLQARAQPTALPAVIDARVAMSTTAIVDHHRAQTTVAVNTLRHGAPLVLDLPDL